MKSPLRDPPRRRRRGDRGRHDALRAPAGARGQLLLGRRPCIRRLRRARDGVRDLRRLRHLPRVHELRPVAGGAEAEALLVVQQFETAQFLAPRDARSARRGDRLLRTLRRRRRNGRGWRTATSATPSTRGGSRSSGPSRPPSRPEAVQETAFAKWLDQTSEREEARRDRVHGAAGIIPTTIWIVLFLSAAHRLRVHAVLRRPRRSEALAGDARSARRRRSSSHAARDLRARQPVSAGVGSIEPVAMERSLAILDEARGPRWTRRSAALRRERSRRGERPRRGRRDGAARGRGRRDRVVRLPGDALERRAGQGGEPRRTRSGSRRRGRRGSRRRRRRSTSRRSPSGSTRTRARRPSSRTSTSSASARSSSRPSTRGSRRGR